ncbi:MAG: hypothetical protein H7Y12_05390 [Sphingobacteriaceae bacterium]|nr:hypothetical protein [Cytophagaceae bacterium]
MRTFWKYKEKVGAELAALRHDPEALLAHLRPYRETLPEHQRLRPVRPRFGRLAPAWKPLTPAPAPKTWYKMKHPA